tara:strand:- start:589 stop:1479 length:891 start_codon:yes stop_codon:yes gene_type:complete
MSTSLCISTEPIIFTRYLYNKVEVKQSLFVALLNRKLDESMFWAYELYFSGFTTDVFEYIINVYREIYSQLNPKLVLFIEKMLVEWSHDKTRDWTIGSIITTLINREYDINNFINIYFSVKCYENNSNRHQTRKFLITLNNTDIDKYRTITGRADKILEKACKYMVHTEYNKLFDTDVPTRDTFKQIYYYHWLYYCLDTPIWRNRIFTYKGKLNHEKKTIEFDDEDKLQEFYDNWGYYPDEQHRYVEEKTLGKQIQEQPISIMEFCMRYEATPIIKKIKTTEYKSNNLTNSMEYNI